MLKFSRQSMARYVFKTSLFRRWLHSGKSGQYVVPLMMKDSLIICQNTEKHMRHHYPTPDIFFIAFRLKEISVAMPMYLKLGDKNPGMRGLARKCPCQISLINTDKEMHMHQFILKCFEHEQHLHEHPKLYI